jgi:hypothetical protein
MLICTPLYGANHSASVALGYHEALLKLVMSPDVALMDYRLFVNTDLVRARSRALMIAYERGVDHLLFWDADVQAPPEQIGMCLRRMMMSGFDLVGAPYARKRVSWDKVAAALANGVPPSAENLERAAYDFPVHDVQSDVVSNGCSPCRYLPMGFTLLTKRCIKTMVEAEGNKHLRYRDHYDGAWHEVVAAFALIINNEGLLLSEDHSFCERYSWEGGKPQLYVGEGASLQHVGSFVYGRTA